MAYSEKQIADLNHSVKSVVSDFYALMIQTAEQGLNSTHEQVREHLLHGVSRRISILQRSISNVFRLFPLSSQKPISRHILTDVDINLHAYVINLSGIFDNWAWAYVFRHGLETKIKRNDIGLFLDTTKRYLPNELQDYLSSTTIRDWNEKYLKSYRDALAHRIPLYIPPANFTQKDGEQYSRLESEKLACIEKEDWGRHDEIPAEQAAIGKPCFAFLHAINESTPPNLIYLHPQMISDGRAVVEFGNLFLEHWHKNKQLT